MSTSPVISPELRRTSLRREFKLRMIRPGSEHLTPFSDRITTTHADSGFVDLPELHSDVRENIAQQIAAVRAHQRSQVVLLSGEAGAGKSHILRHFAQPEVAEECGYVFVGGSNDWKVDEFQPCLLDWMITALTAPSPTEDHLLLDRIRAIGFRALGQLLENRTALKRCTAKTRRFLGLFGRRRASYETIEKLTKERNPDVFKLLDFTKFGEEVCTRFLAEPSNPVHRYALRVLLAYLFPDPSESGLGTRDRVLNWFRRRSDDGYWAKRLGVADDLGPRYAVADAIKLLIHLFSPDLTRRLSVDGDERRPLVFLFVFDQVEGRDELFDNLDDWNTFFAHLSELYNTLPNVLVLFTMTVGLRNELHPKMERQFKDRIRKDERFVLRQPTSQQIRALYRERVSRWIRDDVIQQGIYTALPEADQYLPFSSEEVTKLGGGQSIRGALAAFDTAFYDRLRIDVIEPNYDFEFVLNEQLQVLAEKSEYDYTADHLDTVWELLEPLSDDLAPEFGIRLAKIDEEPVDKLRVLRLDFVDPLLGTTICVYLTRFGVMFNAQVPKCETLLFRRRKERNFCWMVRPKPFEPTLGKPEQMFARLATAELEARLTSALHLLGKRAEYVTKETWPAAWKIILKEIRGSYLGELLSHVAERANQIRLSGTSDDKAGDLSDPTTAS